RDTALVPFGLLTDHRVDFHTQLYERPGETAAHAFARDLKVAFLKLELDPSVLPGEDCFITRQGGDVFRSVPTIHVILSFLAFGLAATHRVYLLFGLLSLGCVNCM